MRTALHVAFWGQLGILTRIYLDRLFQVLTPGLCTTCAPPAPLRPSFCHHAPAAAAMPSASGDMPPIECITARRMGAPAAGDCASRPRARSADHSAHTSQTCRQTCSAPSSWASLQRPRCSICRARRHGPLPHPFLHHNIRAFASAMHVIMPNLVKSHGKLPAACWPHHRVFWSQFDVWAP